MATRLPEKGKIESLIGLETARRVLKERVSELRTSIQKIEQELSAELDRLEKEHTERESEYTNKMSSLTAIRACIEDQFKSGDFEDLKSSILSDTDKKMEALEREYPPHSVELVWEDRVGEQLKKIGSVVVSVGRREERRQVKLDNTPEPIPMVVDTPVKLTADIHTNVTAVATDYKLRRKPVTTVRLPECLFPHGITYDYVGNAVYIVNSMSCMIHTYSITTNQTHYITIGSFTVESAINVNGYTNAIIAGQYGQSKPSRLCFSPQAYSIAFHDGWVYITERSRDIVTRDFITWISWANSRHNLQSANIFGKHGSLEGEMNTPTGIAFSESCLYVCDSNNNRINVYSNKLIVRTITHTFLYLPLDVKIHKKSIFVLNSKSPYVLEFDLTGYLLNKLLLDYGWDSNFMPSFFCIDSTGRFLITDKREPYIYVFKKFWSAKQALETRLELEHGEDRLVEPRGVCLDREGRVIVVCNYKDAMLQIF